MSIHKSLATKGNLVRSRNVLTRYERILQLVKSGKWNAADGSPYGLPKVRVLKTKKRVKEKKKKEEDDVAGAAGTSSAAATEDKGGKGGKGK
jgi:small basic protein (TIGR04137 family)